MKINKNWFHLMGAGSAIIAGLAHLVFKTVSHSSVLPHVIFFAIMGLAQIWWGWQFLKQKQRSELFLQAGTAINGGFALMWLLTRFIAPPFMIKPEGFEIVGWSVAALQMIALVAIFVEKTKNKSHWKLQLMEIVIVGFVVVGTTFALYGGGMIGESFFPDFMSSSGHHGGGHH